MYCVKCGVELDESAKKCPLCNTDVMIPENLEAISTEHEKEIKTPYSQIVMIPPKRQKKFIAMVISMVLLIPSFVCVIANLMFKESGIWSAYVISSAALVWLIFVLPFLAEAGKQVILFLDMVGISLYMLMFSLFTADKHWFLEAALPCVLLLWLLLALLIFWLSRAKRDWPDLGIAVLLELALYSLCADAIMERYFATGWPVRYSVIVSVSCLLLIIFFIAAKRNKYFRAWISRNFYY